MGTLPHGSFQSSVGDKRAHCDAGRSAHFARGVAGSGGHAGAGGRIHRGDSDQRRVPMDRDGRSGWFILSDWPQSRQIRQVRHEPGRRTYKTRLDGLEPDTLYFVRIKVVDNRQRVSDASPEAHARTGCAPPTLPPSNVALTAQDTWRAVRISWLPPSKQSWLCSDIRYRVEYKNGTQPARQAQVPG